MVEQSPMTERKNNNESFGPMHFGQQVSSQVLQWPNHLLNWINILFWTNKKKVECFYTIWPTWINSLSAGILVVETGSPLLNSIKKIFVCLLSSSSSEDAFSLLQVLTLLLLIHSEWGDVITFQTDFWTCCFTPLIFLQLKRWENSNFSSTKLLLFRY